MSGFLLDTNHLGAALDGDSAIYARLLTSRREGKRIGTCAPVLCELAVGLQQTARRDDNWKALKVFLGQVRVWPLDADVARHYGAVYHELRGKGRVMSQTDMMVAALARHAKLTVLTTDRDFEALPDIARENWLQT